MVSFLCSGIRIVAVFAVVALSVAAAEEKPPLSPGAAMVPVPTEKFQPGGLLQQAATPLSYVRKYGTTLNDSLTGITTDALGNVYITGNTANSDTSGFLRKYSPYGVFLWDKTKTAISIDGVTLDKNGNAYIVGAYISGAWPSTRHNVYLEKYDTAGNILWTKSIAAAPASDPTLMFANGIATDPSGNNFIIILFERAYWPYQSREVFIRKYNVSGGVIWENPVGTSSPYTPRPILAIASNGNAYTAVNAAYNQRWNMTISRFDTQGVPVWSTAFFPVSSSYHTYIHGITADTMGNVYVSGITKANIEGQNLGYYDAFIRKYDINGAAIWTRQFGTSENDYANSLTTDAAGNLYVAGSSSGVLAGRNFGSFDAIIRKYRSNGNLLQSRQFGSPDFDMANFVWVDAGGATYVAGHTNGNLGGAAQGGQDVCFRKLTTPF